MQTLALQATFNREDSQRWARNIVGVANDNGTSGALTIDINEKRLDGTPNPYFLHPYLTVDKPRSVSQPSLWDTDRLQMAYRLDLTKTDSKLLKYLGWFQLTAYGENKDRTNRQYSYRDAIASQGVSWIPDGTYRGFQSVPTGTPTINALTTRSVRQILSRRQGSSRSTLLLATSNTEPIISTGIQPPSTPRA